MLRITTLALLFAASTVLAVAGSGQQQDGDAGASVRLMEEMPARGSTKKSVRSRLGSPRRVIGPVGEPPITRWVYEDFTVYFEHNRVLHSVKRPEQ